jgi:hypothetical protein
MLQTAKLNSEIRKIRKKQSLVGLTLGVDFAGSISPTFVCQAKSRLGAQRLAKNLPFNFTNKILAVFVC